MSEIDEGSRPRYEESPVPLLALTPEGTPPEIALEALDPDALKVIQRLRSFGHQAYLVGGCVRDLLIGGRPKDFDVATSAHPGEIRAVFRNCRLIGRRFRLAHVYFRGGKVVETATFRANPNEELDATAEGDLLITRDNVFGTAEEDARRRDFTVNGLFYDVVLGRVIDYVGGREDLAARRIRTIGDPDVRMREDPVRLLRAVRFAAKCDFSIEENTWGAMIRNRGELARCAPPRVLEEIFRLLRSGFARRCFELLRDLSSLPVLLPPLADFLERSPRQEAEGLFEALGLLDEVVRRGPVPDDAVLLSALLVHLSHRELMKRREVPQVAPAAPVAEVEAAPEAAEAAVEGEVSEVEELEALEKESDAEAPLPEISEEEAAKVPWSASAAATSVEALLAELVRSARLPRRIAERARMVLHAQRILSGVRRRRGSPLQFVKQGYFPDALLVFELYAKSTGHGLDALERWRARHAQIAGEAPPLGATTEPAPAAAEGEEAGHRRRRRRGGRRRRRPGEAAAPGDEVAAPAAEVATAPAEVVAVAAVAESLPPEPERRPPPGPADLLPF